MRTILGTFVRWLANIWSIGILAIVALWIIVDQGGFPAGSRWVALGYFPPVWFILFLLPPLIVFLLQKRIRRLASLLLIYLVFFLFFGDLSLVNHPGYRFQSTDKTQVLSVAALNLRYYSAGFEKVVTALNEINADIYLLSENEITPEQIKEMKRRISPKSFFMGQQEGTAIISRYPVRSFREIKFPTRQASLYKGNTIEDVQLNPFRSFVHAEVDVGGVIVHAISVRFIAGRAANRRPQNVLRFGFYVLEQQQKELDFFLDYLKQLQGPIIFGGDLNATPSSVVIQRLAEVGSDLYLQDHTWGGFTFWTNFPSYARLDYIFAMHQVEPLKSEKLAMVVSDHFPVYAEMLIPAAP